MMDAALRKNSVTECLKPEDDGKEEVYIVGRIDPTES